MGTQKTVKIAIKIAKNRPIFIKLAISNRQDFAIFPWYGIIITVLRKNIVGDKAKFFWIE